MLVIFLLWWFNFFAYNYIFFIDILFCLIGIYISSTSVIIFCFFWYFICFYLWIFSVFVFNNFITNVTVIYFIILNILFIIPLCWRYNIIRIIFMWLNFWFGRRFIYGWTCIILIFFFYRFLFPAHTLLLFDAPVQSILLLVLNIIQNLTR